VTKFWVRRVGDALHADSAESFNEFSKLPVDKPMRAVIDLPRNPRHSRLFFALCARIAEGIGETTEFVERAFKVETNHFDHFKTADGRDVLVLRSISFAKFDQVAFNTFFERCVEVAYSRWGVDPASVADLLAPEESQARK
jgi:hypothetical protein